jgi:phosphomannomutase
MSIHYIFDVDGTLTPSRNLIDPEFEKWFFNFCGKNNVYLVTGSDRVKTIEQIGIRLYFAAKRVYNCSGNEVWERDSIVHQNKMSVSVSLLESLKQEPFRSQFPIKTGNHIEQRMGLINFSTVGRNATREQREKYKQFDIAYRERHHIATRLTHKFPNYQFQVAGEIGIDIVEKGKDKAQIIKDFETSTDKLVFFGDTTYKGGNDYPLAKAIEDNQMGCVHQVNGWPHTFKILKFLSEDLLSEEGY